MVGANHPEILPPDHSSSFNGSSASGVRTHLIFKGKELQRIPPGDPLYNEASILIGQGPRPARLAKPEQEPSRPMLDWTGRQEIPKFRDPLPDEDRREWWKAREAFVTAFIDEERIRLGRKREP